VGGGVVGGVDVFDIYIFLNNENFLISLCVWVHWGEKSDNSVIFVLWFIQRGMENSQWPLALP